LRVLAYVGVALFVLDSVAAVAFLAAPLSTEWVLRALAAGLALHLGWFGLAFGTLGIYLARVYKDTIGLPLFVGDPKHSTIDLIRHHD
jgi:hypothetical protein